MNPYRPIWRWLLRELAHDLRDLIRYGFSPTPTKGTNDCTTTTN